MKPEQWTAVINTNLGSLFNMSRQVIEGMRERKFGRIINISSINGQKGQVGQTNYSAAKAGEIGFTKALAQEGARLGVTARRAGRLGSSAGCFFPARLSARSRAHSRRARQGAIAGVTRKLRRRKAHLEPLAISAIRPLSGAKRTLSATDHTAEGSNTTGMRS
jgi:NAD(P)-dependent dehydrogenase (short-subunit alcohol dehydrogenase family)